jgi:hypothetical protein
MKKAVFVLLLSIILGTLINAQNMQKGTYNDGRIVVYIENRTKEIYVNRVWKHAKIDRLILENISNSEVTIKYTYKSVFNDMYDNFVEERVISRDITLSPGQKSTRDAEVWGNIKTVNDYYYIDSFAIMNISVKGGSTSSNNSNSGSPFVVPNSGLKIGKYYYYDKEYNKIDFSFYCIILDSNRIYSTSDGGRTGQTRNYTIKDNILWITTPGYAYSIFFEIINNEIFGTSSSNTYFIWSDSR